MEHSESIGALAAALAKAQGAMAAAIKDASNPFFKSKYADLASIVEAIKVPLSSNELAYVQATDIDEGGGVIVETALMHSSGEWLSSRLRMTPVKSDPQGIGSCITYARRYGLQALVGIPAEDDDGNASTGADREIEVNKGNTVAPKSPPMKPAANLPPPNVGEMAQQNGTPLTPDLPEGADPAQLREWFTRRLKTIKPLKWNVAQKQTKPQALAMDLKQHGFKETDRPDLYEFFTGVKSAKEMSDEQIYLLEANAHRTAELTACAEAMREERAKLSEKLV